MKKSFYIRAIFFREVSQEDKMKKIGIIGAMENEVKTLIQMMDIEKTVDKASLKFYIGK